MKRILLLTILSLSLFADIDLNNKKDIDNLGLSGLINTIESVKENTAGCWFLYRTKKSTYKKVINDDLEYAKACKESYKILIEKINKQQELLNQITSVNFKANFKKYDLKNKRFPLSAMTENKVMSFFGSNTIVSSFSSLKLKFDNIALNNNYLPMSEINAKSFIEKRKDEYGSVDNNLIAKYYFKVVSIDSSVSNIQSCEKGYNCKPIFSPKLLGHIQKMEIIDKNKNILKSYNY